MASNFPKAAKSKIKMAVSAEVLEEEFSSFGVSAKESQLNNCVGFCICYGISEEQLVENWLAFSTSHLPSTERNHLKDANLEKFDEYLMKQSKSSGGAKTPKAVMGKNPVSTPTILNIGAASDILSTYGTKPVVPIWKTPSTPVTTGIKRAVETYSPEILKDSFTSTNRNDTSSSKYKSRSNQLLSYIKHGATPETWCGAASTPSVEVPQKVPEYKYMHQNLRDQSLVLDDVINEVGQAIVSENELEELANPTEQHPDPVVCVGRVCCEASDARLNSTSVFLQSSLALSKGGSTALDIKGVSTYGLFPGQIIGVRGVNPTGKVIHVSDIFYPSVEQAMPIDSKPDLGLLQMVIASGPFHLGTSLDVSPLEDLLAFVRKQRPHILLLLGPVMSAESLSAENWPSERTFAEEFAAFVERLENAVESIDTRVCLVSSSQECSGVPVYPTPPYAAKTRKVMMLCDPCFVEVEGIRIAATSTDVYGHIANEEICSGSSSANREQRVSHYILEQKSMYPLYPPSLDLNIDFEHWESHAHIEEIPHVLVLPSNHAPFIKLVDGCLVVNPDKLTKEESGGSFARLAVDLKSRNVGSGISAEVVYI